MTKLDFMRAGRFVCAALALLLAASGEARGAWSSGDYLSPLGPAKVAVAGGSVTITFPDVPGIAIEGKADGPAVFTTGGGDVSGMLSLASGGAFSFVAEGETMLFEPSGSGAASARVPAPVSTADAPGVAGASGASGAPGVPGAPGAPLAPLGTGVAAALASKRQSDPYFGFSLLAPEGWTVDKNPNGFLMKSGAKIILASPHQMNERESLRSSLGQGVQFPQAGTVLNLEGEVADFGKSGVTCRLAGTVDGNDAKALNVALVSPHGGGASIVAWASPQEYDASFEATAREVAESIRFTVPEERPEIREWRATLAGARLSIIDSDYTSGMSLDGYGTGSGYSIEKHFDFCSDGAFRFSNQSSYSVDAGSGGVAGGGDDANRAGRWSVEVIDRFVVLLLEYQDGQVAQHVLTAREQSVFLDDEEWQRSGSPHCS